VNLVEIQRLSLANINPNKPTGKAKSAKPARGEAASKSAAGKGAKVPTPGEVLVSVSSSVADSNGIDLSDSHLSFAVDVSTGSTVLNIVDDDSGEVIRQIPPDDVMKLKKTMGAIQGLVLDRKA
jgi:flagellar protein FlaG